MEEALDFINFLKKIEEKQDEYVIYLDKNSISVHKKDGTEVEDGYFHINAYSVLWEMLELRGFNVEEG